VIGRVEAFSGKLDVLHPLAGLMTSLKGTTLPFTKQEGRFNGLELVVKSENFSLVNVFAAGNVGLEFFCCTVEPALGVSKLEDSYISTIQEGKSPRHLGTGPKKDSKTKRTE
jgi:hypothetical protein